MSLQWYRRPRMVALNPNATALEAARALENNEIGAVLVIHKGSVVGMVTDRDLATRVVGRGLDPASTELHRVMSQNIATLPPTASYEEAIDLMCAQNVRRIPLVEDGDLVGIVSFDDLILDEDVPFDLLSAVVESQIGAGGPADSPRSPAAQRSRSRAEGTYRRMLNQMHEVSGLDSFEKSATATEVILSCMIRRLTPDEAEDFVAQLPSILQASMRALPAGQDTDIDKAYIERELVRRLDIDPETASGLVESIGRQILKSVSPGEAVSVFNQLPSDLREAIAPEASAPPSF